MRSKRWLVSGIMGACGAATWMFACGNDSFSASSDTDADVSETSTDGPSSDASNLDAGVFCSSQLDATWCADFDEPPDLRTAFYYGASKEFFLLPAPTGGGGIGLTDSGFSAPYALEVAVPIDAGPPGDAAVETAALAALLSQIDGATHFRIEAQIRFNQLGSSGPEGWSVLGLFLGGPMTHSVYVVNVLNSHVYLESFSPLGQHMIDLGAVSSIGDWANLVIDIDNAAGGEARAQLGSNPSASSPTVSAPSENNPILTIGPSTSGGTGPLNISFDNVLFFADVSADAGDAD